MNVLQNKVFYWIKAAQLANDLKYFNRLQYIPQYLFRILININI